MPRPTKQQIEDEILETAAALFARHGFKETSIQRVADAVGYSKTGLLHRYPSKEALQEAVVDRALAEMRAVEAEAEGLPVGPGPRVAVSAPGAAPQNGTDAQEESRNPEINSGAFPQKRVRTDTVGSGPNWSLTD